MPLETHIKRANIVFLGIFIFFSFIELVQTGVLVGSCESRGTKKGQNAEAASLRSLCRK